MKIFSRINFKEMPWSNGGGTTTELLRLEDPFVFRLSVAKVEQDGPFSLFPMIDRTLFLLSGTGFSLNDIVLDKKFSPLSFKGEMPIYCSLLNGPSQDFNVMIDRRWGKSHCQILNREADMTIHADHKLKYIFDYDSFQLWQIENNDQILFPENSRCPLIVVEVEVYAN